MVVNRGAWVEGYEQVYHLRFMCLQPLEALSGLDGKLRERVHIYFLKRHDGLWKSGIHWGSSQSVTESVSTTQRRRVPNSGTAGLSRHGPIGRREGQEHEGFGDLGCTAFRSS